jgi:pseudaminic acid cytidylyltransferase
MHVSVAVIPARSGSKRIPRKNVREFCGKPMLWYPVQAALSSGCFERIVVSTDDEQIAEVARHCGAEVPFIRPPALADDHTGTMAVVVHAISALGSADADVCCIYATAPFLQPADLKRGAELLAQPGIDFALSVTSYAFPIQRAVRSDAQGRLVMFHPEHFTTRSQDLPAAYHDAGQFCWGHASAWTSGKSVFSLAVAPVVLPRERVQDIDTAEDWRRAETMWQALQAAD